ncbi:MAG: hypothetical protein M1820_008773 [Bogoriella megaspora]|nr:MAG: hypothetical protein M1820_008773 [Bogoriella megaspora]
MHLTLSSSQHDVPQKAKRLKLSTRDEINHNENHARASKIFAPFRTIGLISPTAVPFTSLPLGKTTFQITTSVGRSLQTYDLRRGLNLVFITRPQTPEPITATRAWQERICAAWGGEDGTSDRGVWVFSRGKKVGELENPPVFEENVEQILIFGNWVVGCCSTKIEVWKSATLEHYTTLEAPFSGLKGTGRHLTGGICNMPTYLNKLLAGREDGTIEIWNLSSNKLVYTILPAASDYGAVTAMQPTPAMSLLAIAYANGPLTIHDIRLDKEVIRLKSITDSAPVSSISFRTDGLGAGEDGRKSGVMATSSLSSGDVTFWDLNSGGRKMGMLPGAHSVPSSDQSGVSGGISKLEFLPGQAVLITSGLDNALKSWIFEEQVHSPIPRILHVRAGHAGPVSALEFLPPDSEGTEANGKWLMSASQDGTLWGWSLRRDGQSTELSQGNIQAKAKKRGLWGNSTQYQGPESLKAPKITCIASSLNRDGGIGALPGAQGIWNKANKSNGKIKSSAADSSMTGWESVVTGHEGNEFARTWFWGRKRAGRWAFPTGDGTEVKSVAVSPCGTFALIGSAGGSIDMFNLQSGMHRQRFPARLTQFQAKQLRLQQLQDEITLEDELDPKDNQKYRRGQGKHIKAVTGLAVDNLNRTVVSCGSDGKIKFWDFATGLLRHELDVGPMRVPLKLQFYRPSDLVAIGCSGGSIYVIDLQTKRIVRELQAHTSEACDFCFSSDGRWIVAACTDAVIRIWDLPTGHLIDASRLAQKCTAIALSNSGEFFATAREGNLGIDIWTNRTLFTSAPTRPISEDEIADLEGPTTSGEGGQNLLTASLSDSSEAALPDTAIPSMNQLSEDMITLSLVPKARWQTLLHLDLIRARNKPKSPPKAPQKAPFFLPSLHPSSSTTTPDPANALTNPTPPEPSSRILKTNLSTPSRPSSDPFTTFLHQSPPSSSTEPHPLVAHLVSLPPSAASLSISSLTPDELTAFVEILTRQLRLKRDFEVGQVWMSVFLKAHGDAVVGDGELADAVGEWREECRKEMERLGKLVRGGLGVVGFLRGGL